MDQITDSGSYYTNHNNNNNNNNIKNNFLSDEVNDAQQQQPPNHFNFVKRVVPLSSSANSNTTKRHRSSISEPKSFMSSISSNPSSNLNSLDFWDYTIELECLQGPKGWSFFNLFV